MEYAIEVKDLCKSYGNNNVLKGINLNVSKGEIFAFLGVNGAGKTTVLECIEGLRPYDKGNISLNGKIGIQLQSTSLQSYIKPLEAINLFAKWNNILPDKNMLSSLGIFEFAKKNYTALSTGQKRRLHLALSLVGNPDIVFLDEPTAGLDVEGRFSLHEQIRNLKNKGKTIILASHDMSEVENLCDRLAILKNGELAFVGTVDELTKTVGRRHKLKILTSIGYKNFETENLADTLISVLSEFRKKDIQVIDIKTDRESLEQHFINIARRID